MEKPRVKYEDVFAVKHPHNTVAYWVEEYIKAMKQPGAKGISYHQDRAMRIWQRSPCALVDASMLKMEHYDEHARLRKMNKVPTFMHRNSVAPFKEISAATIGKDFSDWTVVATWAHDRRDADIKLELLKKAKRLLKSDGLISKSTPRDRRPTFDEFAMLEAEFDRQNEAHRLGQKGYQALIADMLVMQRWQLYSGRRRGESCAMDWRYWNREAHTYVVQKMKDPRKKNKVKTVALPIPAQVMLEQRWWAAGCPTEGRIFPWDPRTVSSRYTDAKKRLGIENFRLHDLRRECMSRLAEDGYTSNEIRLVSGHETNAILDRNYARPDPKVFKGIEERRAAA